MHVIYMNSMSSSISSTVVVLVVRLLLFFLGTLLFRTLFIRTSAGSTPWYSPPSFSYEANSAGSLSRVTSTNDRNLCTVPRGHNPVKGWNTFFLLFTKKEFPIVTVVFEKHPHVSDNHPEHSTRNLFKSSGRFRCCTAKWKNRPPSFRHFD